MKAGEVIGIFVIILLGASLLPSALATWYAATASTLDTPPALVNGTLSTAPAAFKTMWNLVPLGVALTVFAGIVMVAVKKFGSD